MNSLYSNWNLGTNMFPQVLSGDISCLISSSVTWRWRSNALSAGSWTTLNKLVPSIHLRGIIQSDADRLEEWPERSSQNTVWTNALPQCKPQEQSRQEGDRLSSSSTEEDLGVLVGSLLNLSQQFALAVMEAKEEKRFCHL